MNETVKPVLMLGLPSVGEHSAFFTNFIIGQSVPSNFGLHSRSTFGMEVGRARNILTQMAIDLEAKYLMFIDEDVIGPAWGMKKLVYLMEIHPEWSGIGGLYATKSYPAEPLIYMDWFTGCHWGFRYGDLVGPIKACGMGFTILRLADMIDMPVESYEDRHPYTNQPYRVKRWFNTGRMDTPMPNGNTHHFWTEDMYFFKQCEALGRKFYVDTSVLCQHYDKKSGIFFTPPMENGVALRPDSWNHTPRTANLGAGGDISPYDVNVDLRKGAQIDFVCDVRSLPEAWTDQFDLVKSSHCLEHISHIDTEHTLQEWVRILKPGGTMVLNVPDMMWACKQIIENGGEISTYMQGVIWGDQGNTYWNQDPYGGTHEGRFLPWSFENNTHKNGFTAKSLGLLMQKAGLVNVNGELADMQLVIRGIKPIVTELGEKVLPTQTPEGEKEVKDGTEPIGTGSPV